VALQFFYRGSFAVLWVGALSSSALWAQSQPGNFVGITPCRVVDTRNPNGTFGGPSITGGTTRVFPLPQSTNCNVPSGSLGYAFNIAVVPQGILHYITMWPDGQSQPLVSSLNDETGLILSNGVVIEAGTNGAIDVYATNTTDIVIDLYGYFAPPTNVSTDSTGFGTNSLLNNTGVSNSAFGSFSLVNATGSYNTASGALALSNSSSGQDNTAVGFESLYYNGAGSYNTGVGYFALVNSTTGNYNTAVGYEALPTATTENNDTAVGSYALLNATTGGDNIAIGYGAGGNIVAGGNNINIGAPSTTPGDESNTIRIGDPGTQTATYIAGIVGATVSGSAVLITANGQLGVASSSARYKDDIQDMGQSSDALMQLRPVTFRYKQPAEDGSKPLQYGLIGEEVLKVYPELVSYGQNGQVESVRYHELPALLLNELQKQHRTIEQLETRLAALESLLRERSQTASVSQH